MTYGKVGMYGGKFLPCPHLGHVYTMIQASTKVDELHIIVSHDTSYEKKLFLHSPLDPISYVNRIRWWIQLTRDLPHVHVHEIYEEQTGLFSDWVKGSEAIKKVIGKPIDVVFSSETAYSTIFAELYPTAKHVIIDEKRETYPISGTQIRTDGAIKHWHMIPKTIQPYFAKQVVVVGTESCGKSTLVKNLALLFNTVYVEEFGRTFYEKLGGCEGLTLPEDYPEIAFEHKYQEKMALQQANKVLFIDTEATVTQYFLKLYLNQQQAILDEFIKMQRYDLWLFLEPDVKWVNDGTRTFGEQQQREQNHQLLKRMLDQQHIPYISISGNYEQRLQTALQHVHALLDE
ncbi:multifunctional transcriptional regulator/nicotinamide-nucleotide adenylyltransferase/ribosylnicotinamide kinase NadR [Hazenella sp. IB182353]|uniref:multifunctional transcriptional regulator/nicotinamide-nucleotide adenylyltransferase/ribosylnicotinamide kinase NadR n=1 Tax=Polycladospora coralii TaxID=2771432 RepID=UPI001746F82B|nr:multifunctional transcriptional regulator/nicotinamide-nucleotide adenylyltransferase/ribosylnicotinamide kinase NadR [Polycladospora coralii]MBS7529475.1 multifunctional transcriptional regulator/nicotinamide-nucleotide adenylyltransferase/ribosylnicotinamide kinase NadR [Polycladospora coralii]